MKVLPNKLPADEITQKQIGVFFEGDTEISYQTLSNIYDKFLDTLGWNDQYHGSNKQYVSAVCCETCAKMAKMTLRIKPICPECKFTSCDRAHDHKNKCSNFAL